MNVPSRLVDLDAGFVSSSPGTSTGLQFRCPACRQERIVVPFDPPMGPGPVDPSLNARGIVWRRTGSTLDDITLTPSVDFKHSIGLTGGGGVVECRWHGWVQNGVVRDA